MSTIFISHSSADNALAKQLEARLRQQNHTCVFLDLDPTKGIVAGRSWERTLYRKLRACRVVVAICTESYLQSHWCFAEIALARMEGKPIVALLADPLAPDAKLPSIITEKQFIDLRSNPEDGYRRLWRGLSELDLLGTVGDWDPRSSPYLGLNAYHEEHAPVFFGREAEIRAGVELLDRGAPGLIMVLGASGSGKSSLARAGILPRLRRESDHWIVIDPFRPGRDPFAELAQSISNAFRRYAPNAPADARKAEIIRRRLEGWHRHSRPALPPPDKEEAEPAPLADERLHNLLARLEALRHEPPSDANASLMEFLDWSLDDLRRICSQETETAPSRPGSTPLVDYAYQLRRSAGQPQAQLLIVIDQFEELLGQPGFDTLAAQFLTLLAASLEVENSPVTAFVTMRSDFLESFQRVNADLAIDFETLSLGPMAVEGMRQVIEAPAKLGAIELEPGLADRLLEDASTSDALPLLSFTLWLMWRDCHETGMLTLDAYKALGGLDGAVAGEADAILARARQQGKEAELRTAFLQMVRLADDGKFARQPVPWDTPELRPVEDLLDSFVERRLLVSRADGGTRVMEVAHESLFRTWKPLQSWIEDHRAEFMLRQQVRHAALAWDKSGHPADHLWRGSRLEEAVKLLQIGGFEGGAAEEKTCKSFIQASEAMRLRQGRRRRNIVVAVTSVLLAFLGYALLKEHEAKSAERMSWSRQQALAALDLLETDPQQSIVTARRAICMTQTYDGLVLVDAQSALNRAVQSVQRQATLKAHEHAVTAVHFLAPRAGGESEKSQRMLSLGRDRSVFMWDVPSSDPRQCSAITPPRSASNGIRQVAIDPAGQFFVAAAAGGNVDLYNTSDREKGPKLSAVLPQQSEASVLAVAPDSSRTAVAGRDGSVVISPVTNAAWTTTGIALPRQEVRVVAMAFSEDASILATGGWDGSVALWDASTGALLHRLEGHAESITALAIRKGTLASAGWDSAVRTWDLSTGKLLHSFKHGAAVSDLVFVAETEAALVLASASWDKTVRLWDLGAGRALHTLEHSAPVASLAVAPSMPDGSGPVRIASGDWNGRVYLWTLDQGAKQTASPRVVAHHQQPVNDLGFNADGSRLASASDDDTIKVTVIADDTDGYDWKSGLDVGQSDEGDQDEKWIAVITGSGVQVQDARRGDLRQLITGYSGNPEGVAFNTDDGIRLAIKADDLFEYYLDPVDLMTCAAELTPPGTADDMKDMSLTELCEDVALPTGVASIWSRVRSVFDGFSRAK
ncbi:WD40 repeat protein [Primorskyibacter sedentarius]|uniref:WD40 repeat protein n=1 Tax=Primorskyibacter sedentarius TaxID=745311 RepID=A0A4R3JH68_9RHOB|nr:TIR domain-containing protein [Primorskyibacter sedentarius]TCS64586.1 WD40 repeat protein [Primorskyibacter sedentarius]